jgi:nucleoside-diphosphate-sugar epimerase
MVNKVACIFGGGGFLGSYALKALLDNGYQVKVASRRKPDSLPMGCIVGFGIKPATHHP